MIVDNESNTKSSNEEQTELHGAQKNLSINQLKSRLNEMNIELDTKKHPKSYYLGLYNEAINDHELNKKNEKIITSNAKNIRTIGNKIRENFMKIKRKRLEGYMDNFEHNSSLRFLVSNNASKIGSENKSSFFGSDTKSKFKSITISKISFPILNDCDDNVKLHSIQHCQNEDKIDIEMDGYNLDRSVTEEKDKSEVNEIDINNFCDEVYTAPINNESNSKINDNMMKIISYNICGSNPLAAVYEELPEINKPWTPRETASQWSSRKDIEVVVSEQKNINDNPVNEDIYTSNKLISDTLQEEKDFENFLDQQLIEQNARKKSSNSKFSSKSQAVVTHNLFKAPRSSSSGVILIKQLPAMSHSSTSLRRIQIRESIFKTNISNEVDIESSEEGICIKNENDCVLIDMHSISHEFVLKFRNYVIIFILGSALAAAVYVAFTSGFEPASNYIKMLMSFKQLAHLLVPLCGFALLAFLSYLIKKNKESAEKENKLIADNCFAGIKENLLRKREIGVQNPEIDTLEFIQEFCELNKGQPSLFMEHILPHIKEHCKNDDTVEESSIYLDGVLKTFWRIKFSNTLI